MTATDTPIPLWSRWETSLTGQGDAGPATDVRFELVSPSGWRRNVAAFWDGTRTWKARFMPDERGTWRYRSSAAGEAPGLHGVSGEFTCAAPLARHRFDEHGPVGLSKDRRHFAHADGTPFFFLCDTVWNGPLLSSAADWETFLDDRQAKRFTAIQFVTHAPWVGGYSTAEGDVSYTASGRFPVNPRAFQRIDDRLAAINARGMLAVPVLIWAAPFGDASVFNAGHVLPEEQLIALARYQVARFGAEHVAWILAGDGRYEKEVAAKWRNVGRAVFGSAAVTATVGDPACNQAIGAAQRAPSPRLPPPLVLRGRAGVGAAIAPTIGSNDPQPNPPPDDQEYQGREEEFARLENGSSHQPFGAPLPPAEAISARPQPPVMIHPMGRHWPYDDFRGEPWLTVIGYQSSHSDDDPTLRWIQTGPPSREWKLEPPRPVINLEPCYEGLLSWHSKRPLDALQVRQAVYWSLLNAPTAGVTYGAHGIWHWGSTAAPALNHAGCGIAQPWHIDMHLPGSSDMRRVAELFESLPWWRLRPDPKLLAEQPGTHDPARFIAAATTGEGSSVFYLPCGGELRLASVPAAAARREWFDPRTGTRTPAAGQATFGAPDDRDWVLVIA